MTCAYYNEHEPYCAAWLRNLIAAGHIAPGDVDARDIQDVTPDDLTGYTQCHFFAGLGGFSYALRLAGWPDDEPVWTGSCPCQPLSSAGSQKGAADERHLWPAFFELIAERRPPTAFGEQVASRLGREWFAGVRLDLESVAYAVGGADLPAASVGAPHIRQRLWWVAERLGDAKRAERWPLDHARRDERLDGVSPRQEGAGRTRSDGEDGGMADATSQRRWSGTNRRDGTEVVNGGRLGDAAPHGRVEERADARRGRERSAPEGGEQRPWDDSRLSGLADADGDMVHHVAGRCRERNATKGPQYQAWGDSRLIPCADDRARRIPESGIFPLAHGVPGRVGQLRAYGNAICPQVAAVFIRAAREAVT